MWFALLLSKLGLIVTTCGYEFVLLCLLNFLGIISILIGYGITITLYMLIAEFIAKKLFPNPNN